MGLFSISRFTVCILLFFVTTTTSNADEFLIDGNSVSRVSIGDFECSPCPNCNSSAINLTENGLSNEIATGELWKFFNNQGISSVRKLTLCLDVDIIDSKSNITLDSVELKIESPTEVGFITSVGLGDNSLVVRGYETASFKPEAKLELDLGYDFMEVFSADSNEKIVLKFATAEETSLANPTWVVQSNSAGFFFDKSNWMMLGAFSGFWVVVFTLLNRFTKPQNSNTAHVRPAAEKLPAPKLSSKSASHTEDVLSGSAF